MCSFFYTGHGYRYDDKESPWPHLLISIEDQGIDHAIITEILESKNPKLLFSLVSSCNKTLNRIVKSIHPHEQQLYLAALNTFQEEPSPLSSLQANYRKLFLNTSGTIISSSATPGQYSYRNRNTGTLYLNALLDSLHESALAPESDWNAIFDSTIKKTIDLTNGRQTPQYALYLSGDIYE